VIRISFRTMAGALLALSLLGIVNGCSQTSMRSVPPSDDRPVVVQPPAPSTPESPYVHVVRWPGETLSSIAAWYTASWQNWEAIAKANPGIDPNRIEIGDEIRIPEALLKTRRPLPSDFLPKAVTKKAVQPAAPSREPVEKPDRVSAIEVGEARDKPKTPPEEVELFAPEEPKSQPIVFSEGMELFEPEVIAGKPTEAPEETGLFGPLE
jgi:hypothetical protein